MDEMSEQQAGSEPTIAWENAADEENRVSSPVSVTISTEDTVGAVLLGTIAIILLVALLRSWRENRLLRGASE